MNEQGKLATDVANNTVQCLMLGEAVNVTSANVTAYLPVIRVYAEEATNLKLSSQAGDGVVIPKGGVEYFGVRSGVTIVVNDKANIMGVRL